MMLNGCRSEDSNFQQLHPKQWLTSIHRYIVSTCHDSTLLVGWCMCGPLCLAFKQWRSHWSLLTDTFVGCMLLALAITQTWSCRVGPGGLGPEWRPQRFWPLRFCFAPPKKHTCRPHNCLKLIPVAFAGHTLWGEQILWQKKSSVKIFTHLLGFAA